MILATQEGEMRFRVPGEETDRRVIVGIGIVQVANNRVMAVVDSAERPEDIDEARAKLALERAKEQLRQKQSIEEYYMTQAAMARTLSRLHGSAYHEKGL